MRLKLMAPFRSHFCLNAGIMPLNDIDETYITFWTALDNAQEITSEKQFDPYEIAFMHTESRVKETGKTLYERIDEDTLKCSLHILELTSKRTDQNDPEGTVQIDQIFKSAVKKEKEKATENEQEQRAEMCDRISDLCKPDPNSVSIRVYDNTISIAQMELILPNLSEQKVILNNHQLFLDILHSVGIAFAHTYIVEFYNTALFPLLDKLSNEIDPHSKYIKSFKMYDDYRDLFPDVGDNHSKLSQDNGSLPNTTVLWVTRSLMFEKHDREFVDDFVEYWLKDIGNEKIENEHGTPVGKRDIEINKLKKRSNAYSLSWLNYAFREEAEFNDAWESMLMSQYFYSALECLNNNLQRVIKRSYSKNAENQLRDLNGQLKQTTATTNLLIIYYSDIKKFLKRDKNEIMNQIMDGWGFSSLVSNAQKRIDLCNERIASLHRKSTERGSFVTDILLFAIGAVSLISLFIALSQYGRILNTDATLGFRDDGPLDIFGIISDLPMDWVFMVSLGVIAFLTVLFVLYRIKKLL